MSSIQSTPLKKKKSIFQKLKKFFNDIPEEQIAVINEASQKRPPQIRKSQSLAEQGSNCKNKDSRHLYLEEDFNQIKNKKKNNHYTKCYSEIINFIIQSIQRRFNLTVISQIQENE